MLIPFYLGALILPQGKNLDHTSRWVCCVLHSDDDISLFVPFIDIPMRLGSLLQWVASINNRC